MLRFFTNEVLQGFTLQPFFSVVMVVVVTVVYIATGTFTVLYTHNLIASLTEENIIIISGNNINIITPRVYVVIAYHIENLFVCGVWVSLSLRGCKCNRVRGGTPTFGSVQLFGI